MMNWLLTHTPLLYFTQSLWRDEAFSILIAEKPISTFFGKLSFEPPFYYILLHIWIKIFGNGEIAARSLSFIGFTLATIVVIRWAEKLYPKSFLSWFLPIFFFINPMLIYYGIEIRTYGWFIFFATLSMYAYDRKYWRTYGVASILGFYTHTYFLLVFMVQIFHYILFHRQLLHSIRLKKIISDPMIRTWSMSFLCMIPWLIKISFDLKQLKSSWYFPVNINLIKSVLGNLFIGYEGTPWYLWGATRILSLILLAFFILAYKNRRNRSLQVYFLMAVFLPLILIIGISFIKPLYVNRYLIPVTIAEIFLITAGIGSLANKYLRSGIAACFILCILFFNMWYPNKHAKVPIRATFEEINAIRKPGDALYATSSLVFFETLYYAKNRQNVFLYNPSGGAFPWYVGDAAFSPSYMISDLPVYPKRAIMINQDGTFSISYKQSGIIMKQNINDAQK